MSGKLYLVGTPIGNLGDISPRGLETLGRVDFIAAEDTRVTIKLLNYFGISKPMISYHEHNRRDMGEKIASRILDGQSCAIVTDAGMPCVSDPGEELVALCAERGIAMEVIPGPTALTAALALSGLPTGRFAFEGFLSVQKNSRLSHLDAIKDDMRTLIFYEAPHKLIHTLADMLHIFGDRRIAIAREMTKLHEEVIRTTLSEAVTHFAEKAPRGEFVLIVAGAPPKERVQIPFEEAVLLVKKLREEGMSAASAAKQIAKETGYLRSNLYKTTFG